MKSRKVLVSLLALFLLLLGATLPGAPAADAENVVLNTSNPANPTVEGQTDILPGVVWGVAVAGNYTYITDSDGDLRIWDISDLASP